MSISAISIGYGIFLIAASITGVVSAMLYYHWVRYGVGAMRTLVVMIFYGLGTAAILMALLGLATQL